MVKSGKPGLKTRKVWLVQPGLHPGKPWFNQAFGARSVTHKEKPNGKLRICINRSQTINKAIKRSKYTILTIEEKLPLLTKAKVFTIVDVSEAFHTIVLDKKSSLLTTFQGPNGPYCYNRMPFGIVSGPEEYQRR